MHKKIKPSIAYRWNFKLGIHMRPKWVEVSQARIAAWVWTATWAVRHSCSAKQRQAVHKCLCWASFVLMCIPRFILIKIYRLLFGLSLGHTLNGYPMIHLEKDLAHMVDSFKHCDTAPSIAHTWAVILVSAHVHSLTWCGSAENKRFWSHFLRLSHVSI